MGVRHLCLRASALALACTVVTVAPSVSAQDEPCTQDAAACGKREFDAGIEAYRAGNFREAADRFTKAHAYRAHPVVLFNLALAQAKLELFVEAVGGYEKVLADPETPKELKKQVEEERTAAERNVATIEIDAGAGAETFVDEKRVDGQPARARVNPGEHRIRAMADGREIFSRAVRVGAGDRLRLAVDRSREVVVPKDGREKAIPDDRVEPPPASAGVSPLWFYVAGGVTLALGAVATWSALDTQSAFDDYERDLPKLSQSEVNRRVAEGHDKERRTNILIGGAVIALAGTAVLGVFFVDWSGKSATAPRRGSRSAPGARVVVGPRGIAAIGTF
jgi:hypothetical protein